MKKDAATMLLALAAFVGWGFTLVLYFGEGHAYKQLRDCVESRDRLVQLVRDTNEELIREQAYGYKKLQDFYRARTNQN